MSYGSCPAFFTALTGKLSLFFQEVNIYLVYLSVYFFEI